LLGGEKQSIGNEQCEYDRWDGAVVGRPALIGELAQAKDFLSALIRFYMFS